MGLIHIRIEGRRANRDSREHRRNLCVVVQAGLCVYPRRSVRRNEVLSVGVAAAPHHRVRFRAPVVRGETRAGD